MERSDSKIKPQRRVSYWSETGDKRGRHFIAYAVQQFPQIYSSLGYFGRWNASDYYKLSGRYIKHNTPFEWDTCLSQAIIYYICPQSSVPLEWQKIIPTEFRQRIRDPEKIFIIFQSSLGHIQSWVHAVNCIRFGPHPYLRHYIERHARKKFYTTFWSSF